MREVMAAGNPTSLPGFQVKKMNEAAASRAASKIATPKNCAASCGVFIIPRKRD
jgi:hypothetical protein